MMYQINRVGWAFIGSRLLNAPFWALHTLLPFILYRDLKATPFQVAMMIILRPLSALLAFYWGNGMRQHPNRLRMTIMISGFLGHLPFLFFPFFVNPWFMIFSSAFYMLMQRGSNPAWMEVIKRGVLHEKRASLYAYGATLTYIADALFPYPFGLLLDHYAASWRWLIPCTVLISWLGVLWQFFSVKVYETPVDSKPKAMSLYFSKPWTDLWKLLCNRLDFRRFQLGFMMGGGGLMMIMGALPTFFMGTLQISYTDLAMALGLFKGIGFAMTAPFWTRFMKRWDLFYFCGWVTLLAALFPIALWNAQFHIFSLYGAYILYGMMQAGSELGWNLSGPLFARDEDSTPYSSANILMVGLRGCLIPAFGSWLCLKGGPQVVMTCGALVSGFATFYWWRCSQKQCSGDKYCIGPS